MKIAAASHVCYVLLGFVKGEGELDVINLSTVQYIFSGGWGKGGDPLNVIAFSIEWNLNI